MRPNFSQEVKKFIMNYQEILHQHFTKLEKTISDKYVKCVIILEKYVKH